MSLEIHILPILHDNYAYLLRDDATHTVAVVDPGAAEPVLSALKARGWPLHLILNTHHHADHVGGNLALHQATGAKIAGSHHDRDRIPGLTIALAEDASFAVGAASAQILPLPGHCRGHIGYYFAQAEALFCGDTLFALGCGRILEGTAAELWDSLRRLRRLPAATRVYCGHEYTAANARFAQSIEPDNLALQARIAEITQRRAQNQPTIPSLLAEEFTTNPFLRADTPTIARKMGLSGQNPLAVFAALRRAKDHFAG